MSKYIVLLLHSVESRNMLSLKDLGNIRPELLERLLAGLKKNFDIVSMQDFLQCIADKQEKNERLISLTFDDGAKSYATNAVPIMESLGIPSTCFLITDCVGDNTAYWRYLYNYCINSGNGKILSDLVNNEYNVSVREDDIITFTRDNFSKIKNGNIVRRIFSEVVSEEEYKKTEHGLFLSFGDIEILKQNPLVSFGIHTQTHPVMMKLNYDEIFDEISESLQFYKKIIKDDAPMFSIPFGRLFRDYDERTVIAAQGLSLQYIFSAYGGDNRKGQPDYNIRRFSVNEGVLDKGIDAFKKTLEDISVEHEFILKEKELNEALCE